MKFEDYKPPKYLLEAMRLELEEAYWRGYRDAVENSRDKKEEK